MTIKRTSNTSIMTLSGILIFVLAITAFLLNEYSKAKSQSFESAVTTLETQSESTEEAEIEEDINDTDFSDIDREVAEIEAELNASY